MTTNRSPSLILDARQRAMLLEMGVRVWLPSEVKAQISTAVPLKEPVLAPALVLPVRSEPPLRLPVVIAPPSVVASAPTMYTIANMPNEGEMFDWVLIGELCTGESEKLLINMLKVLSGSVFVAQIVGTSDVAASVENQITEINTKVVVALGPHAAKAVLSDAAGAVPFGKLRGATHALRGSAAKVMVTYHPVQLLRHPPAKAQVWKDLQQVMKELREN